MNGEQGGLQVDGEHTERPPKSAAKDYLFGFLHGNIQQKAAPAPPVLIQDTVEQPPAVSPSSGRAGAHERPPHAPTHDGKHHL